jgi:tetratricopeptide (TPR) repeat protein
VKTRHAGILLAIFAGSALQVFATGDIYVESGEDASAAILANKGVELSKKGENDKALAYYDTALRRDPKDWVTFYNRASIYMDQHKWNLAMQDLNSCIRLEPDFIMASIARCWVNQHLGNYRKSLADYNLLVSFHLPTNTDALVQSSRAWLQATCPDASLRNGRQAVASAKAACNATNWGKADYIDTLAAAEAEVGDFAAAMRFEERAISRNRNDKEAAEMYQRHLALFQQHRPVRVSK